MKSGWKEEVLGGRFRDFGEIFDVLDYEFYNGQKDV